VNGHLATAIGQALEKLGDPLPDDWRRIVMVKNDGPVPIPSSPVPGDPTRGFNLLILSEGGAPTHYVRCRDRSDPALLREGELLRSLAALDDFRPHLPECAAGSSGSVQVLATRFMSGRNFSHAVRGMPPERWRESLFQLTELVTRLGRAAGEGIVALRSTERLVLADEAAPYLAALGDGFLPMAGIEQLDGILKAAGEVHRFPQHGDLWPGNIMLDHDTWRLLDFDSFGQVQVPLFDACHLTMTSMEYLLTGGNGYPRPWLTYLERRDELGEGAIAVLHHNAEAHGFSRQQAMGAVIFYLVELAARLTRRRAEPAISGIPLQELAMIADLTAAGARVDSIIFPGLANDHA